MTVTITLSKSQVQLLQDSIKQSIEEIERLIDCNTEVISSSNDRLACNDYTEFDDIIDAMNTAKQQLVILRDMYEKYSNVQQDLIAQSIY